MEESGEKPTQRVDWQKKIKHKVNQVVRSGMVAVALSGYPSEIDQKPYSQVMVDQKDQENSQLKERLQQEFGVEFDGDWSILQLQMMETALSSLPESLVQGNPSRKVHFIVDTSEQNINSGSCSCKTYLNDPPPGIELDFFPIKIGKNVFENQTDLDLISTHELAHYASGIEVSGSSYVWYQEDLERIVGMDFGSFSDSVYKTLQDKYPTTLKELKQYYNDLSEKKVRGIIDLRNDPSKKELKKVERWVYATTFNYEDNAPIEVVGVLAEEYRQGKEEFFEWTEGIVDDTTAQAMYDYMKDRFFNGMEYGTNGEVISRPEVNEVQTYFLPKGKF